MTKREVAIRKEERASVVWEFENWVHIWARNIETMPEWKELLVKLGVNR